MLFRSIRYALKVVTNLCRRRRVMTLRARFISAIKIAYLEYGLQIQYVWRQHIQRRVEPEQNIEHAKEMCHMKNGLTCRGVDFGGLSIEFWTEI